MVRQFKIVVEKTADGYVAYPLITRRAEFHGLCPWVNEKAVI